MYYNNNNVFKLSDFAIDAKECLELRRGAMPPVMLDLRSTDEHHKSHISGATSIPAEFLKDRMMMLPPFGKIVVYGGDDDALTGVSIEQLKEKGFEQLSYVTGGYPSLDEAIRTSDQEVRLSDIPREEWGEKIEDVLDKKVRPALASDGGGLKVIKIENDTVFINYQGACSGCASAATGTLQFIKKSLSATLNHEIEVIAA